MQNEVKISVRQFTVLVTLFTIGTTILVIPAGLATEVKQDAWISALLGTGLNAAFVWLYNQVGKYFPDMTLLQHLEKIFGKWLGKLVSLFFVFFSFIGAATVVFYMGNFINTQVMTETPIQAIHILFAGLIVMGLRLGLEPIARAAEILFPWVTIIFLALVACLIPDIQLQRAQPVLEAGIKPLFHSAISVAGTASLPMIVLLMVFPAHVNNHRKSKKAFFVGTLLGSVFFVIITFLCIVVLGADTTAKHMYPSYALAKKINIGNFLQRIEILVAAIWFITVYFKATFYFYGFVAGFAQVVNIRDYRPLVLPMGMILVVFSFIVYPDVVYMAKFDTTVFIPYVLTIGFILPILVLLMSIIKGNGGRQ